MYAFPPQEIQMEGVRSPIAVVSQFGGGVGGWDGEWIGYGWGWEWEFSVVVVPQSGVE